MSLMFSKGDIVLADFKFGKHPAYVVYDHGDDDVVVCLITSTQRNEPEEVEVPQGEGNLYRTSYIRTHKIATMPKNLISPAKIGRLSDAYIGAVDSRLKFWLALP